MSDLQAQLQGVLDLEARATPGTVWADWDDGGVWYIEPLGITGTKLRGDSGDCIESATAKTLASSRNLLRPMAEAIADAERLLDKLDAVAEAINPMFTLQFARTGVQYTGPNWGPEYKALREKLAALREKMEQGG